MFLSHIYVSFFKKIFIFREGKGREKEVDKHQCEWNQWAFALQVAVQLSHTAQGNVSFYLSVRLFLPSPLSKTNTNISSGVD